MTLEVPDFDYEGDDAGNVVVTATIRNTGNERADRTVTVRISAGDGEASESTDVSLGPDDSTEERFEFDVPVSEFEQQGSIDFDLGA